MPVRVAYVTAHCPYGPTEPFAIAELLEVRRRGVALAIFPVRPDGPVFHDDASSLVPLAAAPSLLAPRVLFGALATFIRTPRRAIGATLEVTVGQRPAVAMKNLAVVPKGLWLGRELRRRRIEHVHAYWSSTPGTVAYVAARVSSVPLSLTAHSWDIPENNTLERKVDRSVVTRVIAEDGKRKLAKQVSAKALTKVQVIHLGVVLPAEVPAPPSRSQPVVVVPASLLPVKGHAILLGALARLKSEGLSFDCRLLGEGPLRSELERMIREGDLEDVVRLEGRVPHDELLSRYAAGDVDIVVLPSIRLAGDVREGIPIALVEAMASGIPVVGSSTGGIPELLGDGAGLLVPERDTEALAAALRRLLTDAAMRRSLGIAGRSRVEAEFEVGLQTRRVLAAMGVLTGDE